MWWKGRLIEWEWRLGLNFWMGFGEENRAAVWLGLDGGRRWVKWKDGEVTWFDCIWWLVWDPSDICHDPALGSHTLRCTARSPRLKAVHRPCLPKEVMPHSHWSNPIISYQYGSMITYTFHDFNRLESMTLNAAEMCALHPFCNFCAFRRKKD